MWYKILVNKNGKPFENDFMIYNRRKSYEVIFSMFDSQYCPYFFKFNLGDLNILAINNILAIINEEELINILVIKQDKQLFIDKSFKLDYPVLYKKFESVIQSYSGQGYDIIYTNYCGRSMFLEFEKPKFATIKERDELVSSLLDEVYN
jgi:hypothetical protein